MINFDKMHGNGNDFIVYNIIESNKKLSKSKIQKLSNRNSGIGFDQAIQIGLPKKDNIDFSIRFFNADGGEASMCLNGIRCAASYVWQNNFAPKKSIIFKTKNREVTCQPLKNMVKVTSKMSSFINDEALRKKLSKIISSKFELVDSGNMHLCIKKSSIQKEDLNAVYKNLAKHIKPLGYNLSLYKISGQNINIRTYENGVGETLSCGSAALAVASICIKDKCKVSSPGGEISFLKKNNDIIEMLGPTEYVYSGQING